MIPIQLLLFCVAAFVSLLLMPAVIIIARRLKVMDVPGELTIHSRPIPRIGGVAIWLSFVIVILIARARGWLPIESPDVLTGILLGGLLISMAGVMDDVRRISPLQKLLWQFLGASVAIGLGVQLHCLPFVSVCLTFTLIYLVGGANAINLLDGMNGLAAGVVLIAALSFSAIAGIWGEPTLSLLALALAGSVLGFMPFNYSKAKAFMGDVGSLFLGFTLACFAILLANRQYNLIRFLIPLAILGLPIFDTGLAVLRRFLKRDDVFTGDRDHIYDILGRKWGNQRAVIASWGLSALLGIIAVVAARWDNGWSIVLLLLSAILILLWSYRHGVFAPLFAARAVVGGGDGLKKSLIKLRRRLLHPFLLDVGVVVVGFYFALLLRFGGGPVADMAHMFRYGGQLSAWIFFIIFIYCLNCAIFGLYERIWHYASSQEALDILGAGGLATLVLVLIDLPWGPQRPIPISVVLMGGLLSTLGLVAIRYRQRLVTGVLWRMKMAVDTTYQRTLIVGAGEAGQLLAWQMQNQNAQYRPVGFVDDDPDKINRRIHGVRVLDIIAKVPALVERHQVELVAIALPEAEKERVKQVFEVCQESSARIQVMHDAMAELETNHRPALRDLTLEDLVGRQPRPVDDEACRSIITGRTIMVTGAAGSIGSELCHQVIRYQPAKILALDQDETGLYNLAHSIDSDDHSIKPVLGDVTEPIQMEAIFRQSRPAVVFHCAAYKHVPILEQYPAQAIWTNVHGTQVVADLAGCYGTDRFVFVSSDKAACPINVLGTSKRVGELLTMAIQETGNGQTHYSVVRFGNVLGSRGSVVPIFAQQIENGGPVTITHPEMERFFMSIQEAVSLVVQAGAFTSGGDLFVLDMGEQIRIKELASKMIRLQGLRVGQDIQITFSGIRPGEKLSEILSCPVLEQLDPTPHPSILRAENHQHDGWEPVTQQVEMMVDLVRKEQKPPKEAAWHLTELLQRTACTFCPEDCSYATIN